MHHSAASVSSGNLSPTLRIVTATVNFKKHLLAMPASQRLRKRGSATQLRRDSNVQVEEQDTVTDCAEAYLESDYVLPSLLTLPFTQPSLQYGDDQADADIVMQVTTDHQQGELRADLKRKYQDEIPDSDTESKEIESITKRVCNTSEYVLKRPGNTPLSSTYYQVSPLMFQHHALFDHQTTTTNPNNLVDESITYGYQPDNCQDVVFSLPIRHNANIIQSIEHNTEHDMDNQLRPVQCNPRRYFRELIAESNRQRNGDRKG